MSDEDFESGEEIRGAYAESRIIKGSIIYKKNEVLQLIQDHHYYSYFGSYPLELMPKITCNLITLYSLIRPMLTPKKSNNSYKEFKKKIQPVMNNLIENKEYKIKDKELYEVVNNIIDFIHLVGISDLTVKDGYSKGQEELKY